MDIKTCLTVFTTVFVAELGDKTQLATMLFATGADVHPFTVFLGASLALVLASAIGVLAGTVLTQFISARYLHGAAGIGFIAVGMWTLFKTFYSTS
jgi:putative Ca2+/H+ antiporter (TMEM165/GDT1 family)